MKSVKKALAAMLTICCVCATLYGNMAYAATGDTDPSIQEVYVIFQGVRYDTDEDHLNDLLTELGVTEADVSSETTSSSESNHSIQSSLGDNALTSQFIYYYFDVSNYKENVSRSDLLERISSLVYNSTSDTVSRTVSYSGNVSYSCNYTLTATIKSCIESALGFSLEYSVSYSDSSTLTIRPGYYGWVEYYPIMTHTEGNFCSEQYINGYGWYTTEEETDLYTPEYNADGQPDGVYLLRTSQTKPSY